MEDVTRTRNLRALLPPALLYAAIAAQSCLRVSIGPIAFQGGDKVVHFAASALLAFLIARGIDLGRFSLRSGSVAFAVAVAITALLGALDEVYQHFVPWRQADVWDALADLAGALAGVSAWTLWKRRSRSQRCGS